MTCDDPENGCDQAPLGGYDVSPLTPAEQFHLITGLTPDHIFPGRPRDPVANLQLLPIGAPTENQPAPGLLPDNRITNQAFHFTDAGADAYRAPAPDTANLDDRARLLTTILRFPAGPPPRTRTIISKRSTAGFEILIQTNGIPVAILDTGAIQAQSALPAPITDNTWQTLILYYNPAVGIFQLLTHAAQGPKVAIPGDCRSPTPLTLGAAQLQTPDVDIALLAICTGPDVAQTNPGDLADRIQTTLVT